MTIREQTQVFRNTVALLAVCFSLSGTAINESLAEHPLRYPVKMFPSEQVPAPSGILSTDIAWIDNSTLIYKLLPSEGDTATATSIVTVNLDTLERKELDAATHRGQFCYDTMTKNIVYSTSITQQRDGISSIAKFTWGVLGSDLNTTEVENRRGKAVEMLINRYDCSFHYPWKWDNPSRVVEGVYMTDLPQKDGRIGRVIKKDVSPHQQGTLLFEAPEGKTKVVSNAESGYLLPAFDMASGQYWLYQFSHLARTVTVWRYDRQFNLLSQKTYPPGPWPTGTNLHAVKPGYLIYRSVLGGAGKFFLLSFDGTVTEVFSDFGLRGGVSISPDGCRAVFLHQEVPGCCRFPQQLAYVNLC